MAVTRHLRLSSTLVLLLLLAAARPAHALQLGETRAQVEAKHGAPGTEDRGRKLAIYFWEGWSAQLEFRNDAIHKLTYRRAESLQDADIAALLQSNGGADRWKEVTPPDSATRKWWRDDGATAECPAEHPTSIVFENAKAVVPNLPPAAPTVVTAAKPAPTPSVPLKFPKLLGERDEAPAPPVETGKAAWATPRPLPKLATSEVGEPSSAVLPDDLPPLAPPTVAPETKTEPATAPSAPTATPAEASSSHGFWGFFLTTVLVLAGLAAGGWFYWRRKRQAPASSTAITSAGIPPERISRRAGPRPGETGGAASLENLRPDQYDLVVAEIFRREGYGVELSAAVAQADHIDLTLRRDSETILVQSKHWLTPQVGEGELREFYNAMAATGAPRGIFVTIGEFAREARVYGVAQGIELMDRTALEESAAAVTRAGEDFWNVKGWVDEFLTQARIFDPECPVCQSGMTIRTNRTTGIPSWVCRNQPRCTGKREARVDLIAAAAKALAKGRQATTRGH